MSALSYTYNGPVIKYSEEHPTYGGEELMELRETVIAFLENPELHTMVVEFPKAMRARTYKFRRYAAELTTGYPIAYNLVGCKLYIWKVGEETCCSTTEQ